MSQDKSFQSVWLPLIIFIGLGAAFVGVESIAPTPTYQTIHPECDSVGVDEDGDGLDSILVDSDCWEWPYQDGNGESSSTINNLQSNYQPYFDLSVDFVRGFVDKQCNNNLAGCMGTNFQNEVQFYCYFDSNVMASDWFTIFDSFFNKPAALLADDGSITMYQNTCNTIGPAPTSLGSIQFQQSSEIPINLGGDPPGSGMK